MKFRIHDKKYAQRIYMHEDIEIQFRNQLAEVPASVAYHMSRNDKEPEFVIEQLQVPFNPDSWKKERRMIWKSNVSSANGFGMVAENTIRCLLKAGIDVRSPGGVSGNAIIGGAYVDDVVNKAFRTQIEPDCLEIQHCQPPAFKETIVERRWMHTMFETTHTPKSWIPKLNQAERILVPSKWLVENWKEQGVTVPINVNGHGIDPSIFYYLERPVRETYTFLHYGQLSARKGTELVARAFVEEFGTQKDVKLILKNVFPYFPIEPRHKAQENIQCISATYSKEELRNLLFTADCFVFPTRGEGFGLPPFEAMATGLPAIVTDFGGCKDYIDPVDTLPLQYGMSHAVEFDGIYKDFLEVGETTGDWAEPDLVHLKHLMRWCYENREKAKAMGKHAAQRIGDNWTWEKKIEELIQLIDVSI